MFADQVQNPTVLLVLCVLAAVALRWVFGRPSRRRGSGDSGAGGYYGGGDFGGGGDCGGGD